jgi:outer membrane protein OmpA-like peptidoglycan-associated protein
MSTKVKVKTSGKVLIIFLILAGIFAGKVFWYDNLPQDAKESTVVGQLALPDAPEASLSGKVEQLSLPQADAVTGAPKVVWKVMAWNSQFPLMYANGGPRTTAGSLFQSLGVNIQIERQDDCNKTIADLVAFAQAYKENPSTPGVFASFMGDGMPAFFSALTKELEPLGPEYQPIAFYTMGKSYGEDQLMGPIDWKRNPQSAKGKTVSVVLRDGDMNIVLKWAGDNGIKVNPDETSYDPSAINLIAANDFLDAANKYITGYREKRKLVQDGKKVNIDTTVGVDAVSTWTPGDVNIAQGKGGLVTIASTKQYSSQMPNITITIKKFAYDNRSLMENIIIGLSRAGDQVRSFTSAKKFAADVSAQVYNEKNGDYWLRYYNGVKTKDAQGLSVELGGSMAFNLADAANMFGLGNDRIDRYRVVYKTFGDINSKMYPEYMATYPEYTKVVDKSFMASILSNHPELLEGKSLTVNYASEVSSEVSSKAYHIQFRTGSSEILPGSYSDLDRILESAVVAENLTLGVYGHTDDVGNPESNQRLSEARAQSVKNYLVRKGLRPDRIEAKGFGESNPIESNLSESGRATNRRVQIVLGE